MTKYLYLPNVSDKLPFGERLCALRTRVAFGMIGIAGGDNDDDDHNHNHNQDHDELIGIAGEEKVRGMKEEQIRKMDRMLNCSAYLKSLLISVRK